MTNLRTPHAPVDQHGAPHNEPRRRRELTPSRPDRLIDPKRTKFTANALQWPAHVIDLFNFKLGVMSPSLLHWVETIAE